MPAKKAAAKKKAVAKKARPGRKPGTAMSAEHKAALASGRTAGRAVRHYLEALETNKPKRGRKRTAEGITNRLARIEELLPDADPMARLVLVQEQLDLENERAVMASATNLAELEKAFIEQAKTYGENKGISYTAWRTVGVSAEILKAAGIGRGREG